MNEMEADKPQETVLHAVSRVTGEKPKVLLRDSDSEHVDSPYVSPNAKDSQLFPKGRGNYKILGEAARSLAAGSDSPTKHSKI